MSMPQENIHAGGNRAPSPRAGARLFRYAALLLGTAGLGLLYVAIAQRAAPVVRIGEVRPAMNFAGVRIAGTVTGDARVFRDGERVRSLRFIVDDGTGEILVTTSRSQADALVREDRVPRRGDRIELAGSLGVSADNNASLRLQSPDQLRLTRAEAPVARPRDVAAAPESMTAGPGAPTGNAQELKPGEVTADMAGQKVKVTGRVAEVREPQAGSKAPCTVTLQDGEQKIAVVYWDAVASRLETKPVVGALVSAEGVVNMYKGQVQVKVSRSEQISIQNAAAAPAAAPAAVPAPAPAAAAGEVLKISAVTPALAGKTCTVRGTLGESRSVKGGVIYTLADDSGTIKLVLWDRRVPGDDRSRLATGCKVKVSGEVSEYKGSLELVPANAQAIEVEQAAAGTP